MPSTAAPSNSAGFTVHKLSEIAPQSETQRWLIEPLWLNSGVGVLGGLAKLGKTFLAAEFAIAVASGRPALGHFTVHAQGPVLFYGAEDPLSALRVRFDGLAKQHQLRLDDLPLYCLDVPLMRLDRPEDEQRLHKTVAALAPRLLVLDPLIRIASIDENSAQQVASLLSTLRLINRQFDVAILVVHHARKSPAAHLGHSLRGSGDITAWSDSNLYLCQSPAHLELVCEHRNAPAPPPFALRLCPEPQPHFELLQNDHSPATHFDVSEPILRDILRVLQSAPQALPSVEIRDRLRRRKDHVTAALATLQRQGHIQRTSLGWTIAAST
jgi:hypothetical protein